MPKIQQFNYFLYSLDNSVNKNSVEWKSPLPLAMNSSIGKFSRHQKNPFTIGDYFESVRSFLALKGINSIADHVSKILCMDVSKDSIEEINITLEKHGEFYHPAKIETKLDGKNFSFVVNVAVSDPGKRIIKKEFCVLQKLNNIFSPSFLPQVYCLEESIKHFHHEASMFLGEWFERYHEFHLSYDREKGKNRIKIWSPDGGFFLSNEKAAKLYQQAAKILTLYYRIDTFEQILSWHQAGGDFIVCILDGDVHLKLITVRNYGSMFRYNIVSEAKNDMESVLEALVVFLINMTIRMRLDRLDGIGKLVLADTSAVNSCLVGFYQGLKLKNNEELNNDFADVYIEHYLSRFSYSMLLELGVSIIDRHYQNIEEIDLIQSNLNEHIQALYASIRTFTKFLQKRT